MHKGLLLAAFVSFALVMLSLFGVIAHRIALEQTQSTELSLLDRLAEPKILKLSQLWESFQDIETLVNKFPKQAEHDVTRFVLVDAQGGILSSDSNASQLLLQQFPGLKENKQGDLGVVVLDNTRFNWKRYAISDSGLYLIYFLEGGTQEVAPMKTMWTRLLITGVVILWLAVWAALILFGLYSRRASKLEQARVRSEGQFRLLMNSTVEAILGVDKQGVCTFCNEAAVKLLGEASENSLIGSNLLDGLRQSLSALSAHDGSALDHIYEPNWNVPEVAELLLKRKGKIIPIEMRSHPVEKTGKVVGLVITLIDISGKFLVQEEMKKLSLVVERSSDGVFITDANGVIEYLNPAFEYMCGLSQEKILGEKFTQICSFGDDKHNIEELWQKVNAGQSSSSFRIHKRADGEEFYAKEVIVPIMEEGGGIKNIVFTVTDVSLHVAQEEQIQRTIREKQEAESANRAKSSFLARMSHELRTPLNAIIGYSELIQEEMGQGDKGKELSSDLVKIQSAGYYLLNLINDILDYSKIEAGKVVLNWELCTVSEILQDVVDVVSPLMAKNNNKLSVSVESSSIVIDVDVIRLRQCLYNLLSNAAKFTENGEVCLNVSSYGKDNKEWIRFQVIDTGIGIESAHIKSLFSEFYQTRQTSASKYGGTGLGLAISQRLCKMMGGDISIRSKKGEGSCFSIDLPRVVRTLEEVGRLA